MVKNKTKTNSFSFEELRTKENEIRGQLFKLRFQKATGQLSSMVELKALKKKLAQVKTAQSQKAVELQSNRK